MFDPEVAAPLLRHACGGVKSEGELAALAAAWCASRRERRSRVDESQRARMYTDLVRRMDALPAAFVRRASGGIEAACGGAAAPAAAGAGGVT